MKKAVLLSFLLTLVSFGVFAQKPQIEFTKTEHDFGKIRESDGLVSYVFTFKNAGAAPLVIQNVDASCGCTTPEWTKEPVLNGKTGTIKVTFNPAGRPNRFDKTITITSNSEKNNRIVLRIKGDVEAKVLTIEEQYPFSVDQVRLKSDALEMYRIPAGNTKSESLEIYNNGKTPAIVNFENVPAHITIKSDPISIPAHGKATIKCTYNTSKKNEYGPVTDDVTLRVKNSKMTLKVKANIDEDFSKLTAAEQENAPIAKMDKGNHQFGKIKKGSKVTGTFELKNEGKRDLIVRKISNDCDCINATISNTTIKPGASATLNLELTATDAGEKFYSTTITTNAPKQRQVLVYMIGTVE